MTNVTWHCDQESGKLSCKNSLNFSYCNMLIEVTNEDVVADQKSDLGLPQTGMCNNSPCQKCPIPKLFDHI